MKAQENSCRYCGTLLKGRIDKKYCSIYCKNSYYNDRYRHEDAIRKSINKTLKKNQLILKKLYHSGAVEIDRFDLLSKGFKFEYMTHVRTREDGQKLIFCYDQGYIQSNQNRLKLIEAPVNNQLA